jgi:flagellar biosynthesis activator protein FlaF
MWGHESQSAQPAAEHPRQTEHRLFAEITRGLMSAGGAGANSAALHDALDRNRSLWTALRKDLESEANWLAADLKAKLIALSHWVDRHTEWVLRGEAEVGPLIAVNRTIMEGLAT